MIKKYSGQKKYLIKPRIEPINLSDKMTIKKLVQAYEQSGAFNAGRLAQACQLYLKMIKNKATICLTLAGAMTPAGLGGAIIPLIKKGLIDFIISTGANLYHDLHFALGLPVHQGDWRINDEELLKEGICRIYDIFLTDEVLLKTDKFIQDIFTPLESRRRNAFLTGFTEQKIDQPISTAQLHYLIGQACLKKAKYPEKSILAQAAKYQVPIYTSSPGDSSIGMNLAKLKLVNQGVIIDSDLDVLETAAIVFDSQKNGVIEIGGGSPKNFYMQTQPMLWQILGIDKGGHDYFIQITTDAPHFGGLSGATPNEAVSWGKINPKEIVNEVVVYADATIAAPILFSYVLSNARQQPLKRLYSKREKLMEKLKRRYKYLSKNSSRR